MKYDTRTDRQVVLSNMVEINFVDSPEDGFRKVKETLERMGIPKRDTKSLIQTAHILHKQRRYYICHFKELFALDGKAAELSEEDVGRRNLIVKYLTDWNLIKPITDNAERPICSPRRLKVVKYKERESWVFESKYSIGTLKQNVA
jgi:hypothetical protein